MAGNDSTGKQIVFIVCLLGFFATLVMTMPGAFYVVAPDYDETTYPEHWSADDIKATVNATSQNITTSIDPWEFTISGIVEDIYVEVLWYSFDSDNLLFRHHTWGWFNTGVGNIESFPLTKTEITTQTDAITGNYSRLYMTCDHWNYYVYVANPGNYSSLATALTANIVTISIGIAYDYEQSVLSGGDILTRLLIFQLPNVTAEVNFLIALPIYTLIGFLAFVIITMVVDMFPLT